MTLPTHPLGNSGLHITRVGFGSWAVGGGGWGGGRSGGQGDESRGNAPDENGGGPRGPGPGLPPLFRIEGNGNAVDFADSTGALFQEITVGSAGSGEERAHPNDTVRRMTGRWNNGALVVERTGRRGGTMTQTFKLDDHGQRLEIKMERKGGSGGREIKLVYRRAA